MEQKTRYLEVLDTFAQRIKGDPNVIALLLSGSLAYGTVWEKSDIDLTLLVRDGTGVDKAAPDYCLDGDGIEMHLALEEVASFKRQMRRQRGGEGSHSYLGYGRLVFSKDESLYDFLEETRTVGQEDAALSFIDLSEYFIVSMIRAEKWVRVFHDPLYAQRFLAAAALNMADMILLVHGEDPNRESLLRAMELEPETMRPLYEGPYCGPMTEQDVLDAVALCDAFLMRHMDWWSAPILRCLSDGAPLRVSQCIKALGVANLFYPLSYLAQKGVLTRVTQPARVFKHSKTLLEEVAYLWVREEVND